MDIYLKLYNFAKNYDHSIFLGELKKEFNYLYNKKEMDILALQLQITQKKSRPLYLHGYLISSALQNYLDINIKNITILETGTARGFSSIIMSKILQKNNILGTVNTLDLIPHQKKVFGNCFPAVRLQRRLSRDEILKPYQMLVDKYIKFYDGDSMETLNNLTLERIHFAFLDGHHIYTYVKFELEYVSQRQLSGDIIICDDYTKEQFPGIVQAIDEFIEFGLYDYKIFYGDDGIKKRGYVYLKKK